MQQGGISYGGVGLEGVELGNPKELLEDLFAVDVADGLEKGDAVELFFREGGRMGIIHEYNTSLTHISILNHVLKVPPSSTARCPCA